MSINADLRQVIYALSDALDLVGVDDVAHGKRVGIMAAECAKTLNWPEKDIHFLFDLGLLHDIGVSNTVTHQHLIEEFDWAGSQTHAYVGYELLRDFAPLANMALPVKYHHTRWERLQAEGVAVDVALHANLILLVDRVDAMAAPYYANGRVLQQRAAIRHEIAQREGSYFAPELVRAFLTASDNEAFWLNLEPRAQANYLHDMQAQQHVAYQGTAADLRQLAEIFATIVDAKSAFTSTHSRGVAHVARRLAEYLGISAEQCEKLEIAGLLHDLGKLRIPDAILDKPGKLSDDERLVMNTHSFETLQILHNIHGFEEICFWAAHHHEEPGGHGYPFGVDGNELPLEAQILRAADIFQAMVQDRPYRRGLSREAVADFMATLQTEGRLPVLIGDMLQTHLDELIHLARLEEPSTPVL
ncbi:MAG: HD-GYP domain-containing protein [Pseudomonas sp.]